MSVTIFKLSEDAVICKNIKHYCDFRGLKVLNYAPLTDIDNFNTYELECEESIAIIYIPAGSRYNKPTDLNTLLNTKQAKEIIIKPTGAKKTNTKKITYSGDVQILNGIHFLVNYAKFLKVNMYTIRIVGDKELNQIMSLYKIPYKKCFPAKFYKSKEVVWLGAKLDDVVSLTYPTTASCEITASLRVVSLEVPIFDEEDPRTSEPQ